MRRRGKNQTARPAKLLARVLSWLLPALALGTLAWLWWHAGNTPESGLPTPKESTAFTPATVIPAPTLAPPPEDDVPAPAATSVATNQAPLVQATNHSETVSPSPTNAEPPGLDFPRPVQNVFEAQVCLDRQGLSSGSIDGVLGSQTRAALRAFQRRENLPLTGVLDATTSNRLVLGSSPLTNYTVTREDLARLQPLSRSWLGKSRQSALEFETILEAVAERGHAHPGLIRRLNATTEWNRLASGAVLQLPCVERPAPSTKAAYFRIRLGEKTLQGFDRDGNLLAHFPCSIAQRVEKRPLGELRVAVVIPNPNYTFNPEMYPESPEARQIGTRLVLPPGPNNPVGIAWIGLDRPGYGIHGTPHPEQVGRTESHGCFRLANWNAWYLLDLAWVGMPVLVER